MTRDDIIKHILVYSDDFKQSGITGLFMFGSRARGDNRPSSDLDLFVDYAPEQKVPSYFKLLEAQLKLEQDLKIPVHLGTRFSIDPHIRSRAESDAVRIF
jgi:uncharacterized protein